MARIDMPEARKSMSSALWLAASLLVGVAWTLFINGAVPFAATPTIGQAASMLGYAQSFADQHWYAIHARSFGYPVPAALATGLPLAWAAAWFLRFGMSSPDAYAAAAAVWLLVGFFGAWLLARVHGVRPWLAAFAAATWMSMPMVWGHQGYSSLGLGMAMLPLYVWSAWRLFEVVKVPGWRRRGGAVSTFVALCVVALFMDGYTFMMFAVAAWLGLAVRWGRFDGRAGLSTFVVPVYLLGFASAYALYTAFIGRSAFEPASLDTFRGWAVDLTFLAKPTHGELWLWDAIGWARDRSQEQFYGDASVWTTTFVLPLTVAALACLCSLRLLDRRIWPWLIVAAFGMYMALGPSLKLGATKPPGVTDSAMPASAGLLATGNSVLSEHLPGFRNMRAVYRWEALFILGLWSIVALRAGRGTASREWAWAAVYVAITASSIPSPRAQWMDYTTFRRDFGTIDRDVGVPMAERLTPGSLVFFVPWTNDIMATYLAPKMHVVTYNVSGDKQIDITRAKWPMRIGRFSLGHFDAGDATDVRDVLLEHEADAIVVPFFDGLNASHVWPCAAEARGYSTYKLSLVAPLKVACPEQLRAAYAAGLEVLRADPLLGVDVQPLFAVARLRSEYAGEAGRERAVARLLAGIAFPLDVVSDANHANTLLRDGWYGREPGIRWSSGRAGLRLPVPEGCMAGGCVARLTVSGFAASAQRPVVVNATEGEAGGDVATLTLTDPDPHVFEVPLPAGRDVADVRIDIPGATSPNALGMSADTRPLGIALSRIDVGHR